MSYLSEQLGPNLLGMHRDCVFGIIPFKVRKLGKWIQLQWLRVAPSVLSVKDRHASEARECSQVERCRMPGYSLKAYNGLEQYTFMIS